MDKCRLDVGWVWVCGNYFGVVDFGNIICWFFWWLVKFGVFYVVDDGFVCGCYDYVGYFYF